MHEYALVKAVKENIQKNKIAKIKIIIGQIQQIDINLFKNILMQEVTECIIEFEEQSAIFKCNICENVFKYDEINLTDQEKEDIHFLPEVIHVYVKCPKCKSNDFKIIQGRGIYIQEL